MNLVLTCYSCLIILVISTEVLTQNCYKKCNCWKRNLKLNKCAQTITHLNIELNANEIRIGCNKRIHTYHNSTNDIPSFDAKYLRALDEKSSLTLASMARKCYNTKLKDIRYVLDLKKLKNISIAKDILGEANSITYLKFDKHLEDNENTPNNFTLFKTDFLQYGSHLNTLIINNFKMPQLENYFENVSLVETLDLALNQIEIIQDTAFKNLSKLRELSLKGNKITSFNASALTGLENITLIDLSLNEITTLPKTTFSNARGLKLLNISNNNLENIENDTFSLLSQLEHLDIAENPNLTIHENIFDNLTLLKSFNLSGCQLISLPTRFLYRSKHLEVLNISRNTIMDLTSNSFQNLTKLKIVDLSYNDLKILPKSLFQPLHNLEKIYLSSNRLTIFDSKVFWNIHSLDTIDLSNNQIKHYDASFRFKANNIILRNNVMDKFPGLLIMVVGLQHLDLSYNKISSIKLVKIKELIPTTSKMAIDLSHNEINQLDIIKLEDNVKNINSNWSIMLDLSQNKLRCNCLHYQIDHVPVSEALTALVELTNQDNICFEKFLNNSCPLINIKNCPPPCNCYYTRPSNAINVDCSFRKLKEFPEIQNLQTDRYEHNQTFVYMDGNQLNIRKQERLKDYSNVTYLNLSGNLIEDLKWLPANLRVLNLSDNCLRIIPQETVETLWESTALQKITLDENRWDCRCESIYLQQYLIEFNNYKVNQSEVVCEETGVPLVYTKLCENPNLLKVALPVGLTTILAFISAMLALYFKYNKSIKIYLYSKNMCLWCVAEEELDKEKTYDIFISYSHKDEGFVQKELLTELETGEAPFKICIHYRDWLPGEFISTQIISSVLDSRRTMVVLSNNFMESVWGKMEFRTAHMQAINEGRARVIMVLVGELDEKVLDDEMKTYLSTNTYVKWGDPWFWSKLKYALPHSKIRKQI